MNYNEYMANIKAYRNGTLMQAAPTDALSDWHEKYFDTAVSALSKKMIADHVEHSEDADKFGKDFVSLVAILEEDGVSKQDIGKELEAVSKAAQSQADAAIKKLDSVQHSTDTLEGYQAAIKAYKENHLEHGEWKKHKYIRIENGRYIYPEDVKKSNNNSSRNNQVPLNKQISSKIGSTLSNLTPKKTTTAPTSPASRDQISGEKYVKNKLNEIATGFKNIAKSVQDYRSETKNTEGPRVEEYMKTADGRTITKKEWEDELRKNIAETDRQYHEQKQKQAENEARNAGRKATQEYKESGQHEKDVADEKAKRETMARQDEATKITSMTPEEARKRAAELTKQNTPEKKSEEGQLVTEKTPVGSVTEYKTNNKEAQKIYDEIKSRAVGKDKTESMKNLFEELTQDVDEDTAREVLKLIIPGASKEYYDAMYSNTRKNKFSHSDPRAAFYAAVDEYKSKKGLNQRVPQ